MSSYQLPIRKIQLGVVAVIAALALAACLPTRADEKPPLPKAFDARTYPAHETHENEKFSIAADPFDMPEKTLMFHVKYKEHDLLPVRVIFTNDSDQPVMLQGMKIQLVTVKYAKIDPATAEDVFRRIARNGKPPSMSHGPIPLPRRSKPRVSREDEAEVEHAMFNAIVVDPHSTTAGFFFFDVADVANPLAGATVYINGLRTGGNGPGSDKELFYFEIPMVKYLGYQPPLH